MQERLNRKLYQLALTFFFLYFVGGCARGPFLKSRGVPAYWPTKGWQTSTPERQGMDSKVLADALDHVGERNLALHSLLIVRHGYVILDAYFYPYTGETVHDVASVTKSITSSLIGLAFEKGFIKDLNRSVLDFFPELNATILGADKKQITIKDLLTMSSGLNCGYRPGEPELFAMLKSKDWVQFSFDLPMVARPGTEFAYCSSGMHLLSAVITRTTGMSALDFAREYLFAPLGIQEVVWPSDLHGYNHGWGDLQVHPHDMAKIGYLFINRGQWDSYQILSPDWVDKSTQEQISLPEEKGGYGYGWWISSSQFAGMYEARGRGGQRIVVWPEKDLVVVITAGGIDLSELAPFLLSALKSERALPESPDAYRRLQKSVRDAVKQPMPQPISSLPETALRISGKTYRLAPNKLGLTAFSLQFDMPNEAKFYIDLVNHNFMMPVGLDGVYRFSADGPSNLPVALEGFWQTDNEFVLHYNEVARINDFRINITFEGKEALVQLDDPTDYFDQTIKGKIQP
jgi:CubicO group peptidase (beta-lactamase class C family)